MDRYILILINTNYLIDLFNGITETTNIGIIGGSKTTKMNFKNHILDFIRFKK